MKKTLSEYLIEIMNFIENDVDSIKDGFQEKFNVMKNNIDSYCNNIKNNYSTKNKVNGILNDTLYNINEQNDNIINTSNNVNNTINNTFGDVTKRIQNNYSVKSDVTNFQNTSDSDITNKFNQVISDTTSNINNTYNTKQTFTDNVTTLSKTSMTKNINNILDKDVEYNNSTTNNKTSKTSFNKYIDNSIFGNRSAKLGYLDNDIMANISASYNMSYEGQTNPWWRISDFEGREDFYFMASSSSDVEMKLYRGYRMNKNSKIIIDNESVMPKYMLGMNNSYVGSITYGLSCNYMIASVKYNGVWRLHCIHTNYSGNPLNWADYDDITDLKNFVSNNYGDIKYIMCYEDTTFAFLCCQNQVMKLVFFTITKTTNDNISYSLMKIIDNIFNPSLKMLQYKDGRCVRPYDSGNGSQGEGLIAFMKINGQYKLLLKCNYWSHTYSDNTFKHMIERDFPRFPAYIIYNVPADFMTNPNIVDIKPIVNPDFFYDIEKDSGLRSISNNYGWEMNNMTYDELDGTIAKIRSYGGAFDSWMRTSNIIDLPSDEDFINSDQNPENYLNLCNSETYLISPDTCPWAKAVDTLMMVVDGYNTGFYINGFSEKYGWSICSFAPEFKDGKMIVKSGTWTQDYGEASPNDTCCARSKKYVREWSVGYTYKRINNVVYKLSLNRRYDNNGDFHDDYIKLEKIKDSVTNWFFDNHPGYNYCNGWGYEPASGKEFFIIQSSDFSINNTSNARHGAVVETDGTFEGTIITDSINAPNSYNEEITKSCYNIYGYSGRYIEREMDDNSKQITISYYFPLYYGGPEWGYIGKKYTHIEGQQPTIETVNRYWGKGDGNQDTQTIGYSTKYGMFCTDGYAEGLFCYSFDFINNNKNFSTEDFFSGKGYSMTLPTSGSMGLIAFIQSFPIYLGGYYSVINSQEIYLKSNSVNYIYAERDSE
jgi:hypothetical protein